MKKIFIIAFIIMGTIIGCIIGERVAGINALNFLSIGGSFGFKDPFTLDLAFMSLTFGIWCKINVAGVIALVLSAYMANKVFKWLKI